MVIHYNSKTIVNHNKIIILVLSIGEAIQSVQSLYSKGVESKDSRLTTRHIYSALINARNTVLKQQINKRQKINENCYQILCIELEEVSINECIGFPSNITILRGKKELPRIISTLDKPLIDYVIGADGSTRFDKIKFENAKYISGNKFTANNPKFYIKNNKPYVTLLKMLKGITASIVAEDPLEAYLLSSCGCNDCIDPMELDFYTDRNSFNSISKLAKDELVIMFEQMKEDKYNNASDDIQSSNKMIHQPD